MTQMLYRDFVGNSQLNWRQVVPDAQAMRDAALGAKLRAWLHTTGTFIDLFKVIVDTVSAEASPAGEVGRG